MNEPSAAEARGLGHVLSPRDRLSRSALWALQRRFFEEQGIDAWRRSIVPQYITANTFIAGAYASVVSAFLRDAERDAREGSPREGASREPVNIVELGAGSGRFAYFFLKRLLTLQQRSPGEAAPFRYIMTDLAERNLAFWREHPSLQPFIAAGVLDFARFDAPSDEALHLTQSGETLSPGSASRPLVVIANYFFDGIPLDTFRVERGKLHESLVTLVVPEKEADEADPAVLSRIELRYEHTPALAEGYYDDPDFNRILRAYEARLSDTSVDLPIAALTCCRQLQRLSGGRLLLLSADKGSIHEESLLGREQPAIAVHGSFSMKVNYHAIAEYFRGLGGQALHAAHASESLCVAAFLLGAGPGGYAETRSAFADAVERFGPDDFFTLKKAMEKHFTISTLGEILALVRLAGGDGRIFGQCLPTLSERAREASSRQKRALYLAIEQVWDNYYHLGEEDDLAFGIGMLLYAMEYYLEAITYFQRSLELYGPDPHALFNLGLCHYHLQQTDLARACAERTLERDPAHEGARAMRIELDAQAAPRARAALSAGARR